MNAFGIWLAVVAFGAVGCAIVSLAKRHRGLARVAVAGSVALPVLGLIFTVVQLIAAFRSLATVPVAEKSAVLSQAISEAMNATAAGLTGVVPCLALSLYALSRVPRQSAAITSTPPPQ